MTERTAAISRKTRETDITCTIALDGRGVYDIDTGIGFFDHMLSGFARHGLFDLTLRCKGDLEVDCHHTIEDCGIVLGEAIRKALGDKKAIKRFGSVILPMDEALILCAIDLSGRPYFRSDLTFTTDRIGGMDTEMVREFFYSLSYGAMMNLHFHQFSGENNHHIAECAFKAFGKALDMASMYEERLEGGLWTTKGSL